MIVKLSGNKYINTELISMISPLTQSEMFKWEVQFGNGSFARLSQTQGEELLSVLPVPYDAEGRRKRKQAEATLVGQLGRVRWESMDDDERFDAVSDEVERMQAMQAQEQSHD